MCLRWMLMVYCLCRWCLRGLIMRTTCMAQSYIIKIKPICLLGNCKYIVAAAWLASLCCPNLWMTFVHYLIDHMIWILKNSQIKLQVSVWEKFLASFFQIRMQWTCLRGWKKKRAENHQRGRVLIRKITFAFLLLYLEIESVSDELCNIYMMYTVVQILSVVDGMNIRLFRLKFCWHGEWTWNVLLNKCIH